MNEIMAFDPLTQQTYPAWMGEAVDQLLLKIRHKDVWEIVEFAIAFWMKKNPVEYKKYLDSVQKHRDSRRDKFASFKDKNIRTRELVHIPSDISYILEKIAYHKIEEYGRLKFYKEFAKRYPGFRGGEKL